MVEGEYSHWRIIPGECPMASSCKVRANNSNQDQGQEQLVREYVYCALADTISDLRTYRPGAETEEDADHSVRVVTLLQGEWTSEV